MTHTSPDLYPQIIYKFKQKHKKYFIFINIDTFTSQKNLNSQQTIKTKTVHSMNIQFISGPNNTGGVGGARNSLSVMTLRQSSMQRATKSSFCCSITLG